MADHPHERGDDYTWGSTVDRVTGPPPRAWGRLDPRLRQRARVRTTPTSVGTTLSTPHTPASATDHPHERGDDVVHIQQVGGPGGPPPRAWGRRRHHRMGVDGLRTTPTSVGTTTAPNPVYRSSSDHPHERGDDAMTATLALTANGPPPRAWGRRQAGPRVRHGPRTTPTSVGTTRTTTTTCRATTDHPHERGDDGDTVLLIQMNNGPPHERGDDSTGLGTASTKSGPPPRAWGRPQGGSYNWRPDRTTPTSVGTTRLMSAK